MWKRIYTRSQQILFYNHNHFRCTASERIHSKYNDFNIDHSTSRKLKTSRLKKIHIGTQPDFW